MKIVAFGASHSKSSINKQFANYASLQFGVDAKNIALLDLNDYILPLFTVDVEAEIGHPKIIDSFLGKLDEADLLIISLGEHNGSYEASFKNLFDWCSRVKIKMFENKTMLLLSTSPGKLGAKFVMEAAKQRFPIHGAEIAATFSLPNFNENFDSKIGITNDELKQDFDAAVLTTQKALKQEIK